MSPEQLWPAYLNHRYGHEIQSPCLVLLLAVTQDAEIYAGFRFFSSRQRVVLRNVAHLQRVVWSTPISPIPTASG